MNWYQLAKVLHYVGLIALFGFFVLASRAGTRLRAATRTGDARTWLDLLDVARPMLPSGVLMLTVSGAAMAAISWRAAYPFVVVGLAVTLAIWGAWALVGAPYLGRVRTALGDGDVPIGSDAASLIRDPRAWGAIGAINGAAMGVLVVMTLKPGWVGAIALVLVFASALGVGLAVTVRRARDATVPTSA